MPKRDYMPARRRLITMLGLGAAALATPRGVFAQQGPPQPSAQLTPLAEDVYLYRSI